MTDDVALLLRRAGFGPVVDELAAARQSGYDTALSALVAPPGPDLGATTAPIPDLGLDPFARLDNPDAEQTARAHEIRKAQVRRLEQWWLDRMTVAHHQAIERLLFFWHGHWATSVVKVRSAQLMLGQHRTIRDARDFVDMAHRMSMDRALVYWLDGQHNVKGAPNENLAREMCELFTLGLGHYTERDVKEAGRALTGFRVVLDKEHLVFDPQNHDGGVKTILGRRGRFDVHGFVDLLLAQKACPRFIASRMWYRYGSATQPVPDDVREQMAAEFPAPRAMLRVLLASDAFRATAHSMVKQPVEWLVGAMRQLRLRPASMPAEVITSLVDGLESLGQRPFSPPSVGGWPAGRAWLTAAAAQGRMTMAAKLAGLLTLDRLTPDETAYLLGIEEWTDRTYAVLKDIKDPRLMLAIGLVSPEYLVT